MATWMDVKVGNRTWLPVLRDVLWLQKNLDLWWISPSKYLSLEGSYSNAVVGLLKFLNHVAGQRLSCVEIVVDGKTREATNIRPT